MTFLSETPEKTNVITTQLTVVSRHNQTRRPTPSSGILTFSTLANRVGKNRPPFGVMSKIELISISYKTHTTVRTISLIKSADFTRERLERTKNCQNRVGTISTGKNFSGRQSNARPHVLMRKHVCIILIDLQSRTKL